MKIILSITLLIIQLLGSCRSAFAQQSDLEKDQLKDHQYFLNSLKSAQENFFLKTIQQYQAYSTLHPEDVTVRMEECRFIQNAFYNEDEDYNPKYQEFDECLQKLCKDFPDNPQALLYRAENLYGDSAISFLNDLIPKMETHPELWKEESWKVYKSLSEQFSYQDNHEEVITSGRKACDLNDTLDLSLLLADAYTSLSQKQMAKQVLKEKLNCSCNSWESGRKAELLLQLGEAELAVKTFMVAQKDTSYYPNFVGLSSSFEKLGKYKEARNYLLADTAKNWNKESALERLFLHDLSFHPDSAEHSYAKMRDLGFHTDPLARHRIALFLSSPLAAWSWRDLVGIVILLLSLLFVFILPYVIVLPVQYIGQRWQFKNRIIHPEIFHWGLKSFWLIIAAYFFCALMCSLVFSYSDVTYYFGDNVQVLEETEEIMAKSDTLYIALFCLATLLLYRTKDVAIFWGSNWSKGKVIGQGLLAFVGLKFFVTTWTMVTGYIFPGGLDSVFSSTFLVADDNLNYSSQVILALQSYYGPFIAFGIVALIVPFYEEMIFGGIILSACEKHLNFFWANAIQALLFTAVHYDWSAFIFYFSFGLLAGILRNRSMGLASSIIFHGINNAIAFIALMKLSNTL